jgi:hypothetical protein
MADQRNASVNQFSVEAEELLTSFRVALEPKTKNASAQTDFSEIMETLEMLQAQKDELRNALLQTQQKLRQKELLMSDFKTSVNLKIQNIEEKVKRLKLRNEAVENLFSISKRPSPSSKLPRTIDNSNSMLEHRNVGETNRQITMLTKQLEYQKKFEEKNQHLEKRLLKLAKERGKDKFNIKRLIGERDDAKRDANMATASKKNVENINENLNVRLKQHVVQINSLELTLHELSQENVSLQSNLTSQQNAYFQQQEYYRRYMENLKLEFQHIIKEHSQCKKIISVTESNFYLISKTILRLKSLITGLPTITNFRDHIIISTENAKKILLHNAKERLERKYKKNILQVKQFEIMNNDLKYRIKEQEKQLKVLQAETMQSRIELELQAKTTQSLQTEMKKLNTQLLSNSKTLKSKNGVIDTLNTKLRGNEVELTEMNIRSELMNRLLVSERENMEKLRNYIGYNLEPKLEALKQTEVENMNLKERIQKHVHNEELKAKDYNVLQEQNKQLKKELANLKQKCLARIDKVFDETNDELDF